MVREAGSAYRMTDLQESDRPRERLAEVGASALSDAELLAILLRVGMSGENSVEMGQRLLITLGGLSGVHKATFHEVASQKGIGLAKAAQVKAAIELGRRLMTVTPDEKPIIHSPADAAALVMYEMSGLNQEQVWVINLDTRNRVLYIEKLYAGSVNASTVRIGEIFRAAIHRTAASIILVHNHPSGDPSPSPEDIALTRGVIQAGKLLDIDVLDHLVIGYGKFISLKEKGLGFNSSNGGLG